MGDYDVGEVDQEDVSHSGLEQRHSGLEPESHYNFFHHRDTEDTEITQR
jgi:hypothetical protein